MVVPNTTPTLSFDELIERITQLDAEAAQFNKVAQEAMSRRNKAECQRDNLKIELTRRLVAMKALDADTLKRSHG